MKSIYPFSVFDPWSSPLCTCPRKYSLNPYTGCSFKCLYCYAVNYIGLKDSVPKRGFKEKLLVAAKKLDRRLPVNIGTSSDPYPDIEEKHRYTRFSLKVLGELGFKILVTTKGADLLLRDLAILANTNTAVTPTITTLDEYLARRLEPGAPSPRRRLLVSEKLLRKGVPVGLRLDPIIPGLNDDSVGIKELLEEARGIGIRFVVASTYKARAADFKRMIEVFPEMEGRWRRLYFEEGERVRGYRYLRTSIRKKILLSVTSTASRLGMEYATCREGLLTPEYFRAGSCDGTHLIPQRKIISHMDSKAR